MNSPGTQSSQRYIGAPNGVVLCIDKLKNQNLNGCFFHKFSMEGTKFSSADQMLFELEEFFDEMDFPHPATNERSFLETDGTKVHKQERVRVMKDENLLSKHGDMGTFIIRVQHRQNSSWQGRITWMDRDKTLCFRSIWEMIKLITSALDTVSTQEGMTEQTWDD